MSELALGHPHGGAELAGGWGGVSAGPSVAPPRSLSSADAGPMRWDEQGDRDPAVSNLQAWLGKLLALVVSVGFFALLGAAVHLLSS